MIYSSDKLMPFLQGVSDNVIKYHNASCRMMEHRIKTRMKDLMGEDAFHDELDIIWKSLTAEEIEQVNKLPRMWWFQYIDENGQLTNKSELDVYPYAQYFVDQRPRLLGDDVSHLRGKPFFGDRTWKPNMAVMYLMLEESDENGKVVLRMVSMSNEKSHYEELQRDYDFVRYAGSSPIFKKKVDENEQ